MNQHLYNPHLPGDPFYWVGNDVGVLLLHGLTATPAEVRPLANYLHKTRGYSVSAPLLPGHGTTPQALNTTTWADWAAHVNEAYHYLATQCQHVIVGGESTGAVLALHLTTRQPEVTAVLAYAPAIKLNMGWPDHAKLRVAAPLGIMLTKGSIDVAEKWQGYPENPLKAVQQLVTLGNLVQKNLHHITQPVLIMHGAFDTTIHPTASQLVASGVRSDLVENYWLENSSHVVLLDKEFDFVAETTRRFIETAVGA